jgi:hypothetical protein
VTATRTTRPRIVTSNRLYAAAILAIGMAIPHIAIGLEAHWPGQLMSLHILAIVLLLLAGLRIELAETRTARAHPAATSDEFDNLTQQLRDLER